MAEAADGYISAFGAVAKRYDRSRPGYPTALVDDVLTLSGENMPPVIEVGAGTGRATALFAERVTDIVAIEPSSEMAAIAATTCAAYPHVSVVVSTFEDVADVGRFGLLFSAQAWHWVAPEIRYTKAHSVLRPGGGLALFWSRPLWEESVVGEALAAVYASRAPELHGLGPWFPGFAQPRKKPEAMISFGPGTWLAEGQRTEIDASGLFTSLLERTYRWTRDHTAVDVIDLLQSLPEHQRLGSANAARLFADVRESLGSEVQVSLDFETRLYGAIRVD